MKRRSIGASISVVAALLSAACTSKAVEPLPPPPQPRETTTTTTLPDFSAVELGPAVPGRTTTTIRMGPGKATVKGTVTGPGGPVEGAIVRVERLVGDSATTMDVVAAPEGTFAIPKILGGRYRVRAWKPDPDNLALVEPVVFFLEGSETKTVELTLALFRGVAASAAIAPDPPQVNSAANLVVQVVDQAVDANGFVRSNPVSGVRVELFGSGDWRIASSAVTSADAGGKAKWLLECRRAGNQPLSVVVGETSTFNLNLPECVVPPPTAEESDPASSSTSTSAPGSSTSTSRPGSTTTTTRPSTTTTTTSTSTTRP